MFTDKDLFKDGGEMGALMEAHDWRNHPLGEPSGWPTSLKAGVRILLGSGFPMFIWWSEEFYMFHNDPYLPALGNKHPQALGASARVMWKEIWELVGGIAEGILSASTRQFNAQEMLVPLNRSGFMEETYWTFSYSPIPNDDGSVGGMFCACNEVTDEVLGQRRLSTVKEIASAINQSFSVKQTSQQLCELMSGNSSDIPYSLLYLLDSTGTTATLLGQSGVGSNPLLPAEIALAAPEPDELRLGRQCRESEHAGDRLKSRFENVPAEVWGHELGQAMVLPMYQPGENQLLGFLVLGTSLQLPYNAAYQGFHQLLADQVAATITHVKTRFELEGNEHRLRQLANSVPHLILTANAHGHVDYGNKQWYAYTGLTEAETLGHAWIKAIHPNEAAEAVHIWQKTHDNGKSILLEYRIRRADGQYRWHRIHAVAKKNEACGTKKWYGTITDIHDQKLAEAEVQQSKEQELAAYAAAEIHRQNLERLFMQAPAAICILSGPEMVYEFINPKYQNLFPGRQLLGLPVNVALPEIVHQPNWTILHNVFQTGEAYIGNEVPLSFDRHNKGVMEKMYFNFIYKARYNHLGKVDGILVFAYEVTDLVEARHKVESSEEHLRIALEAGNMASFNYDILSQQTIRSANHDQLFGYASELLDWNIDELLKHTLPEDRDNLVMQIKESISSGKFFINPRIRRKDSDVRWIEGYGKVFYDKKQQPVRIAGLLTDVTERKRAEQMLQNLTQELAAANTAIQLRNKELAKTNEQLTRTNADLDNFVYTASHDLRSPINSMEGLLLVLKDELGPKLTKEDHVLMEHLTKSMTKLNNTIKDLSEIVKVQKDTDQPLEAISVKEVLVDVLADMETKVQATQAQMTCELEVESLLYPKKYLRSILYNLLSNALNYRHPDRTPRIKVRTETNEQQTLLTVTDNGLGMNERQVKKIFGMFQRMHPHTEGSGIGLYTIKRVIDNYGGRITVDSKVGEGTTFRVYFPDPPR
ncbi:PAS domain-containing protein [Pontibacter sp. E15-1]|uniref:PAS domain-containing protein n=1 Tax=Pontibacter sp. E15-1 TaxID=2919918 RepID=UPI001F4F88CA|nr:PAS domain-containing protein [Pontibacter sp. E15-1]MCJ8164196.1 PAS domain-containing protein [Pontibacter sp. E15-1]